MAMVRVELQVPKGAPQAAGRRQALGSCGTEKEGKQAEQHFDKQLTSRVFSSRQ